MDEFLKIHITTNEIAVIGLGIALACAIDCFSLQGRSVPKLQHQIEARNSNFLPHSLTSVILGMERSTAFHGRLVSSSPPEAAWPPFRSVRKCGSEAAGSATSARRPGHSHTGSADEDFEGFANLIEYLKKCSESSR